MKILVTGGAGFIGSWVSADLLARGHEVAIIDDLSGGYRRNIPADAFFYGETLTDAAAVDGVFAEFRPELVIHCAAYAAEGLSHWMRRYCFEQNLISWADIANSSVRHGVRRVVTLSSMSVYGSQQVPFTEDLTPAPEDPYGAGKAAVEADLRALGAVQGIEWIIVRPHNVYGPRQNLADPYRNVVAIFMRQALRGEPLTIFGDGLQTRAFSYIEDVAPAIATLATGERHGYIVNVGGEEPITILGLANLVRAATGSSSELTHLPTRYEVTDAYSDHQVLRDVLGGWHPTPMSIGLPRMAEWANALEIGPLRRYDYEVDRNLFAAWQAVPA
jgi:UDP-glucose 4-epimerase